MSTRVLGCALVIALTAAPVLWADEPPPLGADPISIDRASPSVIGFGNTPGDIYGQAFGPLGGWDIGGPGPLLHVADASYGLGLSDNNDGHSNGEVASHAQQVLYFSGDDLSVGVPGTHSDHQAIRLQAAGDRFVTNGPTLFSPAAVMGGAGPNGIAGPVLPGPINLLSANQHRYNEIPSILPPAFNAYVPPIGATVMDDMDALELMAMDLTGDAVHDTPIYFSLDAISPGLGGGSGADVLLAPPGGPFGLFAPAPTLGLAALDEVDALAVWDADGTLTPGADFALFSLAPGSAFLAGADGLFGTADDLSPADIFVTDFTGANALFLTAGAIGMLFTDNVDAIDVEQWIDATSIEIWDDVPEPGSLVLLALGGLTLVRRRRRTR